MLENSIHFMVEKASSLVRDKVWESIVIHAILFENSFQFDIYYKFEGDTDYEKDTKLLENGIIQRNELIRCYFYLRGKIVESLSQSDENPISGLTITVMSTGRFSVDYEYEEQGLGCSADWKHRYLSI